MSRMSKKRNGLFSLIPRVGAGSIIPSAEGVHTAASRVGALRYCPALGTMEVQSSAQMP